MKREKVKYSEEGDQYKLWYDTTHPYEIEACTSIKDSLYQKKFWLEYKTWLPVCEPMWTKMRVKLVQE